MTIFSSNQTILQQTPNKIVDGKKEEEWMLWYDKDWKNTDIVDSVEYYRRITYKAGNPDGMVNDIYRSGVKQWEGCLMSDVP